MPGTTDLHIMREREVIDVDGESLGHAEDLYADQRTGEAVFLLVRGGRFGTKLHFVPVEGAEIEGEKIRVAFSGDKVNNAPNISADESLSPSEEEQRVLNRDDFLAGRLVYNLPSTEADEDGTASGPMALVASE